MPRILAETGYYLPIQESVCISGCNSPQKVWQNPTLHRLPKTNAISIRDSFLLPRIEEALQAVQAAVWFTSFDLAQGYLQMAMEEADIPKTAFRAGSSSLFEFTRMPFGLTNAGASFCRLMEMVIGDQQFVTLLFYLDDICIFANSADQMLDRIELVFSRLKQYQLKIKPKKSFFFQTKVSFLGHVLSAKGISPNPEKVDKVPDWPVPKTSKGSSFLYQFGFLLLQVHT